MDEAKPAYLYLAAWFAARTGETHAVNAVAFSPDGRLLASGSYGSTVRLWGR